MVKEISSNWRHTVSFEKAEPGISRHVTNFVLYFSISILSTWRQVFSC